MPLILLTNDDGIEAEGLCRLQQCLANVADVLIVAPDRERSAVSHGLTIHTPLDLKKLEPNRYTLNGTPADCVIYALQHVTIERPDLVISGINHGANLGDDILYSGTVAGAREASRNGIAALAISQAFDEQPIQFETGVKFVRRFVENVLREKPCGALCLNINLPVRKIRGAKITRQGVRSHFLSFEGKDGRPGEGAETDPHSEMTLDFQAVLDNFVSITPLQRDQTDYAAAQTLLKEMRRLV